MKDMDNRLKRALTPSDEPDFWLNQKILAKAKEENHMRIKPKKAKKLSTVALFAMLILGMGSVSIYAARKFIMPDSVAKKFSDEKIREAFSSEDAIPIDETQSGGGYEVTLYGIVSGVDLSNGSHWDSFGNLRTDRTYALLSVARTDETPLTEQPDELNFGFFIQGYDPNDYHSFDGGSLSTSMDGVIYSIYECDNLERFADRNVYLAASDDIPFYTPYSYHFDEKTGDIAKNEDYDGLNALFSIPFSAEKADPKAADALIQHLDEERAAMDGEEISPELLELEEKAKQFMQPITPENIEEYATLLEIDCAVQTVFADAQGRYCYRADLEDGASIGSKLTKEELFPNGETESLIYLTPNQGEGMDALLILVRTLNADGSVTYRIYAPK